MMMASTERILKIRTAELGSRLAEAVKNQSGKTATKTVAITGGDLTQETKVLADELDALRRNHLKLQQAIYEAAQVQRRLCAPRELTSGQFEIAGEIFPVRHLSGDFFKVMELGPDLGVMLGDIAGKGLSAGIWQAHLMSLMERSAKSHKSPSDAVAEVNHELCHGNGEAPLTALFYARIDSRTNELVYCNAGLPAPLVLRKSKTLERLENGGPMLGALKDVAFDTGNVILNEGDMLVAFSDGVTECRNAQDEEFEMERLTTAAKNVSGVNASKALFSLLGTVLAFADSCAQGDDLTLLVVRRRDGRKEQSRSSSKDFSTPPQRLASGRRPKHADCGGQFKIAKR
ncbi:MAG TPA: PP2C family protein-serine/threonine phosphatase [Candidatus Acidoferrum sp.]|nr:PP2C family protein-serine/threonine phosphatase [Candidatus Acidoferrum sp.]